MCLRTGGNCGVGTQAGSARRVVSLPGRVLRSNVPRGNEFSIDDHLPQDHLLRSIDRFVDLSCIRQHLADFYSHTGRPSIDPELLIYYPAVPVRMHERPKSDPCAQCWIALKTSLIWILNVSSPPPIDCFAINCRARDTAYGSGPMLGWLVERGIAPHIPVMDKADRTDGTWSRADFEWDADNNQYTCPEGERLSNSAAIILTQTGGQPAREPQDTMLSN